MQKYSMSLEPIQARCWPSGGNRDFWSGATSAFLITSPQTSHLKLQDQA